LPEWRELFEGTIRMAGQWDTVQFCAAAEWTVEKAGYEANTRFIEGCRAVDPEVAALYETINADEKYHPEIGRRLLQKYATTPEAQERAWEAVRYRQELGVRATLALQRAIRDGRL
jgi:hypothetical protein